GRDDRGHARTPPHPRERGERRRGPDGLTCKPDLPRRPDVMPLDRLTSVLDAHVEELKRRGTAKGAEPVVVAVIPPEGERGPRFLLEGHGDKQFIRMNSNSYLGM